MITTFPYFDNSFKNELVNNKEIQDEDNSNGNDRIKKKKKVRKTSEEDVVKKNNQKNEIKKKKPKKKNILESIGDERLAAFGINPKKFHKKLKYSNTNEKSLK